MKALKRFFQKFKLFQKDPSINSQHKFFPFFGGKFGSLLGGGSGKNSNFRLIAPSNQEKLGLPQGEGAIPTTGSLGKLSSFGEGSEQIQNPEFSTYQSQLKESNYQLLFKGSPPLHLKAINSWSDIPLLAPIKNSLSKVFGEKLTPLQKVCLPSLMSGEDHVIQQETVQAATMLFLIPAFMQLLQLDENFSPTNQVSVLILAKDEEQVKNVNNDIQQLQGIFSEGFGKTKKFNSHILVDTPKNVLESVKENKVSLAAVKYFVISDLTGMQTLGLAEDIVAINSLVSSERQMVVVSSKLRNDSLIIDQLMINFKFYVYVLTQYAAAVLQEYALKVSVATIIALMGAVGYLGIKLRYEQNQARKQGIKK